MGETKRSEEVQRIGSHLEEHFGLLGIGAVNLQSRYTIYTMFWGKKDDALNLESQIFKYILLSQYRAVYFSSCFSLPFPCLSCFISLSLFRSLPLSILSLSFSFSFSLSLSLPLSLYTHLAPYLSLFHSLPFMTFNYFNNYHIERRTP